MTTYKAAIGVNNILHLGLATPTLGHTGSGSSTATSANLPITNLSSPSTGQPFRVTFDYGIGTGVTEITYINPSGLSGRFMIGFLEYDLRNLLGGEVGFILKNGGTTVYTQALKQIWVPPYDWPMRGYTLFYVELVGTTFDRIVFRIKPTSVGTYDLGELWLSPVVPFSKMPALNGGYQMIPVDESEIVRTLSANLLAANEKKRRRRVVLGWNDVPEAVAYTNQGSISGGSYSVLQALVQLGQKKPVLAMPYVAQNISDADQWNLQHRLALRGVIENPGQLQFSWRESVTENAQRNRHFSYTGLQILEAF